MLEIVLFFFFFFGSVRKCALFSKFSQAFGLCCVICDYAGALFSSQRFFFCLFLHREFGCNRIYLLIPFTALFYKLMINTFPWTYMTCLLGLEDDMGDIIWRRG